MSTLTLADDILVEPLGTQVTAPTSRRRLGRRQTTQITIRGMVEFTSVRKKDDGGLARKEQSAALYLDPRDCDDASWTPQRGDRVISVTWNDNGRVQPLNLYLDEPDPIAAGGVFRIALTDRSPARTPE